ncbi:hypothetical protein, partial [Porphyromonas sp.]
LRHPSLLSGATPSVFAGRVAPECRLRLLHHTSHTAVTVCQVAPYARAYYIYTAHTSFALLRDFFPLCTHTRPTLHPLSTAASQALEPSKCLQRPRRPIKTSAPRCPLYLCIAPPR